MLRNVNLRIGMLTITALYNYGCGAASGAGEDDSTRSALREDRAFEMAEAEVSRETLDGTQYVAGSRFDGNLLTMSYVEELTEGTSRDLLLWNDCADGLSTAKELGLDLVEPDAGGCVYLVFGVPSSYSQGSYGEWVEYWLLDEPCTGTQSEGCYLGYVIDTRINSEATVTGYPNYTRVVTEHEIWGSEFAMRTQFNASGVVRNVAAASVRSTVPARTLVTSGSALVEQTVYGPSHYNAETTFFDATGAQVGDIIHSGAIPESTGSTAGDRCEQSANEAGQTAGEWVDAIADGATTAGGGALGLVSGTTSGAIGGAAAGSTFGPEGTVGGGIAGAVGGGLTGLGAGVAAGGQVGDYAGAFWGAVADFLVGAVVEAGCNLTTTNQDNVLVPVETEEGPGGGGGSGASVVVTGHSDDEDAEGEEETEDSEGDGEAEEGDSRTEFKL